jgi:hypothetical protein
LRLFPRILCCQSRFVTMQVAAMINVAHPHIVIDLWGWAPLGRFVHTLQTFVQWPMHLTSVLCLTSVHLHIHTFANMCVYTALCIFLCGVSLWSCACGLKCVYQTCKQDVCRCMSVSTLRAQSGETSWHACMYAVCLVQVISAHEYCRVSMEHATWQTSWGVVATACHHVTGYEFHCLFVGQFELNKLLALELMMHPWYFIWSAAVQEVFCCRHINVNKCAYTRAGL